MHTSYNTSTHCLHFSYYIGSGLEALSEVIAHDKAFRFLQAVMLENQKGSMTSDAEKSLADAIEKSDSLVICSVRVRCQFARKQINDAVLYNNDQLRVARRVHQAKEGTLKERKRNELELYFDRIAEDDADMEEVELVGDQRFLTLDDEEKTKAGAAFATNTSIKTIKMNLLGLDDSFAVAFGEAIAENETIEKVNFDSNAITSVGMTALFAGLGMNESVQELQVRHQKKALASVDEDALPELLESNTSIIKLGVDIRNPLVKMKLDRIINANRDRLRKLRNKKKQSKPVEEKKPAKPAAPPVDKKMERSFTNDAKDLKEEARKLQAKLEQEKLAAEEAAKQEKLKQERDEEARKEKEEKARKRAEEVMKVEKERVAAEKAEKERLAAEEAAEQEHLAAEKAEEEKRLAEEAAKQERLAAEEADRLAAEAEEKKLAAEAEAEAARLEEKRLAAEAEEERIAAEAEAARLEEERLAAEAEAETKREEERLAAEAEAAAANKKFEEEQKAAKARLEAEGFAAYPIMQPGAHIDEDLALKELSEDDAEKLRGMLKAQLGDLSEEDEEDAEGLLDYAFDMIESGETVGNVTEEVSVLDVNPLIVYYP